MIRPTKEEFYNFCKSLIHLSDQEILDKVIEKYTFRSGTTGAGVRDLVVTTTSAIRGKQ